MRPRFAATFIPVALASLLAGCASVLDGYQQLVAVETFGQEGQGRVFGAQCELSNPKGAVTLHTPGIVLVRRSFDDLSIRCEKAGFEPGEARVASVTKPMAILGGLSGMAVDAGTGAAFEYPPLIKVTMGAPVPRSPLVPGESLVSAPPPPMANPLPDPRATSQTSSQTRAPLASQARRPAGSVPVATQSAQR